MLHSLIGQTFGHLVVIEQVRRKTLSKSRPAYWKCRCLLCGIETTVRGRHLRIGRTKTCGNHPELKRVPRLDPELAASRSYIRHYRYNAKTRGLFWALTENQVVDLMKKDCFYCGNHPSSRALDGGHKRAKRMLVCNGLDRLDSSIGYTPENVVPCCGSCNLLKGSKSVVEFLSLIEKISQFQESKRCQPMTTNVKSAPLSTSTSAQ